jgi:hypothetical protein
MSGSDAGTCGFKPLVSVGNQDWGCGFAFLGAGCYCGDGVGCGDVFEGLPIDSACMGPFLVLWAEFKKLLRRFTA